MGNFYDRVIFKAVPDFIDFHIGEFHWFSFNIADIFISIGIIAIFLFSGLKICKNIDQRMKLGFFIGFILLFRILLIHPYQIHIDIWDKVHSLPLHLCGISAIISSFILFKFNQILYFRGALTIFGRPMGPTFFL